MKIRETQNIEFKESWREEYLKVVCAFANTHGGVVFLGKNDQGEVVGLSGISKLLEDIPNQIKNILGIIPDVNVKREKGKEILIIRITTSSHPVSYRGKFYKRSGSTTQEINGIELQKFLMEKSGLTWESAIEEGATMTDFSPESIQRFKELSVGRFPTAALEKSNDSLLEKLHLCKNRKPTRAAILLFGNDPQRLYHDSYIKIGRFKDDGTLLAMDDIRGNLFHQIEQSIDILKIKYLNSEVSIESLHRTEQLEFPELALREAIVNAIVHRDYSNSCTQIRIYGNSLVIWNNGELTHGLTLEKLKKRHPSFPRNQLIAEVFYKAGYIEKWGHGTVKMVDECKRSGLPEPIFEQDNGGMQVTFLKDILNEEFLMKLGLNERQIRGVMYVKQYGQITNTGYKDHTGVSKRTASNDLQLLTEKRIFRKLGATGKGTRYVLERSNNGANRAMIGAAPDELDRKLSRLENELSVVDPDDEVKVNFNEKLFFGIYDTWLRDLFLQIIEVGKKFNRLFTDPRHYALVQNGAGQVQFCEDKPMEIVERLREESWKNKERIFIGAVAAVHLTYGTFRKGGLKTFGCRYSLEIHFDAHKYSIYLDEFSDTLRNKVLQFERLLHKPLTKDEVVGLGKKLGETIYQHLDYYTKQQGLRKGQ